MPVSQSILEQLLYEDEGPTLDFKRDQYLFEGGTKDQTSEILKDILAFANAWRRSDAYILIGVDEIRGGKSKVVGLIQHLDDAKLQQFVNSKTQRPLHFSYHESKLDGHDVGVIHIPLQDRPIYTTLTFGRVMKNTVYVRRGSSTDTASPDEILQMKQAKLASESIPLLDVQFFDEKYLTPIGTKIVLETLNVSVPNDDEIPNYGAKFGFGFGYMPNPAANSDYFRDVADYVKRHWETSKLNFVVVNSGSVVAQDVRLQFDLEGDTNEILLRDASTMPTEPLTEGPFLRQPYLGAINQDIDVRQTRRGWIVAAEFGKIQPKGSSQTTSGLFIGSKCPTELSIHVSIFADNLPSPQERTLGIRLHPRRYSLSVDDIINMSQRRSPDYVEDDDNR